MNTNKLNQHLENITNQDIKEMVSRVMDLLKMVWLGIYKVIMVELQGN